MISNATISETAKSLSKSYNLSPKRTAGTALEYGFKKGINWFLDNLWHPASEEPKPESFILGKAKCGLIPNYDICLFREGENWENLCKKLGYDRWFYIDDLLREPVQSKRTSR